MKSKFEEPTAPINQQPPYEPKDGKNDPFWDFRAPQYDQRHSCFIKAGTNYGKGFTQPIGSKSQPKEFVAALPVNTTKLIELYDK